MPVITLTASLVSTLECPQNKSKIDYFDKKCKGLQLEVRIKGGKTWYLRYTDERGKQRQRRIGDVRDLSLEQARQQADRLRRKIVLGEDPDQQRALIRQVPTLGTFVAERYMPYIKTYKRSWRADDSYLRNHILPNFAEIPLDRILKIDIIAWHQNNYASHLAPATANRLLILLRYMFNLAITWEIPGVTKNPTAGIPMFETNNVRERYLSQEEAKRLQAAAQTSGNPMLGYIIPMLILTGARKHEVIEARWADFDLERLSWRIPISKAGKARFVPLSASVLRLLEMVPRFADCAYVFPNPKTLLPYALSCGAWKTVRKRAGLDDVRMHDLRHTFASLMVNSGRSLYEVQQILGHRTSRMTQRYAHLSQETLLNAVNAAADAAGIDLTAERGRGP